MWFTSDNASGAAPDIPSPADPPPGCVFHTRCQYVIPGTCDVIEPARVAIEGPHDIACHLPTDQLPVPVQLRSKD